MKARCILVFLLLFLMMHQAAADSWAVINQTGQDEWISLLTSASLDAQTVARFRSGTFVRVVSEFSSQDWYYVIVGSGPGSQPGYLPKYTLNLEPDISATSGGLLSAVTTVDTPICYLTETGWNTMAILSKETPVTVVGERDDWYYTTYGTLSGWMPKANLSMIHMQAKDDQTPLALVNPWDTVWGLTSPDVSTTLAPTVQLKNEMLAVESGTIDGAWYITASFERENDEYFVRITQTQTSQSYDTPCGWQVFINGSYFCNADRYSIETDLPIVSRYICKIGKAVEPTDITLIPLMSSGILRQEWQLVLKAQ